MPMHRLFAERIYGIPWLALAGVGLALAVFYAVAGDGAGSDGLSWWLLRWGHTVAWAFLGAAAFARSKVTALPVEATAPLAATGGLVYVALMVATLAA